MESTSTKPTAADGSRPPRPYPTGILMVLAISVLIGLLYVPLLHWLGWRTLHTQQLFNGALLVLFALAICVRDAVDELRLVPQFGNEGIGLVALAFACLW